MSKLGDPHKKVTRVKWQFVVYLISLDTPRRPVLHIVVFIDITWIYERLRRHRMVAKQITIKTAGTCPLIYSKFSCFINIHVYFQFSQQTAPVVTSPSSPKALHTQGALLRGFTVGRATPRGVRPYRIWTLSRATGAPAIWEVNFDQAYTHLVRCCFN